MANLNYDEMLGMMRGALRIRTNAFDDEIVAQIAACKIDLNMAGVAVIDISDPSFVQAATLYCKAYFGFMDNAERWRACYEGLRDSMALSREYGGLANEEDE